MLCGVLTFWSALSFAASPAPLPVATDLALEAQQASKLHQPLILLVSLPNCRFCEQIKRDHLREMSQSGQFIIREISLDSARQLINFSKQTMSQQQFAKNLGAKVAPSVYFLGVHGDALAEPLIGSSLPDFYGAYLAQRIASAQQQLLRR